MQPARLDLSIIQGATYRQVLRIMQPVLEYRPISAIAPSAPVQLTVDHGLPTDWPVWVRGVTRMPQLNAEPIRQRPHMATVIDAATLEINPLSATGLTPAGGELVYNLPVDLTGATAVLQVLDDAGGELLNIVPTVNAGGWIEVALSDEATAALTWGTGNWLLDISFSNGDVFRAFTGTAKVWPAGTTPTAAGMCAGGWVVTAGGQGVPGGQGPVGPAFQVDATGPTADRALYDSEPEGFSFLDTTTGELFFREGAGWSDGVPFQGPAGISAYQVALNNGFVGTEAEWLEFLQGDAGADGADGVGIAALVIDGSGHLVVTYTNAIETDLGLVVGASGADGADGAAGVDGRGITSMAIDGSGHLIITYDDTTTEDAGLIPGGGSAVWGGIGGTLADQADLIAALGEKVDKVAGQGLSENDYTDSDKAKLGGIADNATANPDTDSLVESVSPTNKWFTVARVLAAVLTGLSVATGGSVVDTDTVLQAIGKLQKQITDLATAVSGKMANPMNTAGDIIVGDVSGAPARVAKGTDGQVLKMVSGAPAWAAESGGGVSGDMLSTLASSEVGITGAATLTSTAFGKMHVCSGTSADYTVGLPAASGNAGKIIGFRMAPGLTKIVTLDGNASELIDGALVRKLWANETALLLCDGTAWVKVAGKSIPMSCGMYPTAAATVALHPTLTTVLLAAAIYDKGGLANAAGNRINIKRSGIYRVSANNYFQTGANSANETQCIVNRNSASGGVGSYSEWRTVPSTEPLRVQFETDIDLSAGDYLQLVGRIKTGTRSLYVNDPDFTFLKVAEVIEW